MGALGDHGINHRHRASNGISTRLRPIQLCQWGFAGAGAGGLRTIGYGWRGSKSIGIEPTNHFSDPVYPTVPVKGTTDDTDVGLIGPVADVLEPVIEPSDGTRLTATDYARSGSIAVAKLSAYKAAGDDTAIFEPPFAAMEIFGGHPLTTVDASR
jgi:hypothetical protein